MQVFYLVADIFTFHSRSELRVRNVCSHALGAVPSGLLRSQTVGGSQFDTDMLMRAHPSSNRERRD